MDVFLEFELLFKEESNYLINEKPLHGSKFPATKM